MRHSAITAIVGLLVGTLGYAAQGRDGVVTVVVPVSYPGHYYAPPSYEMPFVFLVGERIEVDIVLANWGGSSRTLRSPNGIQAGLRWSDREQPDQPKVHFTPRTLQKRTRTGLEPAELDAGDSIALAPGDQLVLRIEAPAASFTPGRHNLHFETDVIDSEGLPVIQHSPLLKFEVRIPSADDQLELARRAASRAYMAGDYGTARREVARMLQLNATSIFAYIITGDIESAESAWAAALASYQTALKLLDGKADVQLESYGLHFREDIVMKLERARRRVG